MEVHADQAPWNLLLAPKDQHLSGWGLDEQLLLRRVCKAFAAAVSLHDLVVGAFLSRTLPAVAMRRTQRWTSGEQDVRLLLYNAGPTRRMAELVETIPGAIVAGGYAASIATLDTDALGDVDLYIPDGQSVDVPKWRKRHAESARAFDRFYTAVLAIVRTYAAFKLELLKHGEHEMRAVPVRDFMVEVGFHVGADYGEDEPEGMAHTSFAWNARQTAADPVDRGPLGSMRQVHTLLSNAYLEAQELQRARHKYGYKTDDLPKHEIYDYIEKSAAVHGVVLGDEGRVLQEVQKLFDADKRTTFGVAEPLDLSIVAYVKIRPTIAHLRHGTDFRWTRLEPEEQGLRGGVLFDVAENFAPLRKDEDVDYPLQDLDPCVGCVNLLQYVGPQKSPLQVVERFDMHHCQVALTAEGGRFRVHASEVARDHLKHRRLGLAPHVLPRTWTRRNSDEDYGNEDHLLRAAGTQQMSTLFDRIAKYFERGYTAAGVEEAPTVF